MVRHRMLSSVLLRIRSNSEQLGRVEVCSAEARRSAPPCSTDSDAVVESLAAVEVHDAERHDRAPSITRFRECSFHSWRCVNSLLTDCLPVSEHLCDLMTASNSLALCNADGHAFPSRRPSLQPSTRVTVRRSLQRMADFLTIFVLLLGFFEAQMQDEGAVQFYRTSLELDWDDELWRPTLGGTPRL